MRTLGAEAWRGSGGARASSAIRPLRRPTRTPPHVCPLPGPSCGVSSSGACLSLDPLPPSPRCDLLLPPSSFSPSLPPLLRSSVVSAALLLARVAVGSLCSPCRFWLGCQSTSLLAERATGSGRGGAGRGRDQGKADDARVAARVSR
eukprot:1481600-Rhodomonas_salina.1